MNLHKHFVLGALAVLALALAACGGAAVEPTATAGQPVVSEPTAEPTATTTEVEPTATVAEPELTATSTPSESDEGGETPEATEETIAASAGDPTAGEEHFSQVCAACHGPGGTGIEGLGKDLTTSQFVAGLSDQELLAFIQEGRPVDHPDNTTGVAMPPRGGNPDFTDEQLLDIIAYIRILQEE